jgi:hypothetical protein
MIQQTDPAVRFRGHPSANSSEFLAQKQKLCEHVGIDQGFHNMLLHSGTLDRWLEVRQWPQGEGVVNTVGAFYPGVRAIIKQNLTSWGILAGERPNWQFVNWNKQPSSVVHQYDRFLKSDFQGSYYRSLKAVRETGEKRGIKAEKFVVGAREGFKS